MCHGVVTSKPGGHRVEELFPYFRRSNMRAIYLIIAVAMIYMFVLVAYQPDLGIARPLLSVGFFGVALYCLFAFALDLRESRRKPDEQVAFKKQLDNMMRPNKRNRPKRRSRREY